MPPRPPAHLMAKKFVIQNQFNKQLRLAWARLRRPCVRCVRCCVYVCVCVRVCVCVCTCVCVCVCVCLCVCARVYV